jgi:lipopolysaccharide export LptBFGC system permease protein LptF
MNAIPVQEINYPKEAGKLLGSQLGTETYTNFQEAKNRCDRSIQCSGVAYSQSQQKYTLRTGQGFTVPGGFNRIVRGRLIRDENIFDSYPKYNSMTTLGLNHLDQLIPNRNQRSEQSMRIIENQIGFASLEGFTSTDTAELNEAGNARIQDQKDYLKMIHSQKDELNADRESLNTKYLTLIYELDKSRDNANYYAIQRNLVLVLVLLVLLVRNGFLSNFMGMAVGGFVGLLIAGYYVFSTFYSQYRRDPLEWNELSTEIEKQQPPPTEPSCPSSA